MNGPSRGLRKLVSPLFPLTSTKCVSLLRSFTRSRSLSAGEKLHAAIISSGLIRRLRSKLATMYSLCDRPSDARRLFDEISDKNPSLFSALIRGHVQTGLHLDALLIFSQLVSSGHMPDNFSYPFALKACGDLPLLQTGTQIHCKALISGFGSDDYVQNSLISMYMNCGQKDPAIMVFDPITNRSIVAWNTIISGLVRNGCPEEALKVFDRMAESDMEADDFTVVSVLPACAQLKDLERGRRVHELVDEKNLGVNVPVRSSLVDFYSKCGRVEDARRLFEDERCERNVVSWTAMIGGYALNGNPEEALTIYHQMLLSGIRPNSVTMASLLSDSTGLPSTDHCKCVHGSCIRFELNSDVIVETALIDMYTKCGNMDLGLRLFATCSRRTATWNAVLSSYTRNGQTREAIEHFKLMLADGVRPDLATVASVLPAYSASADLQHANCLHGYLLRLGFLHRVEAATALIDAYAKAGHLNTAWELFDPLPVKDVVSWTAIIDGYGAHGHAGSAIELFDRMIESGVCPNEVTFTSILHSCSHSGLVDVGLEIFDRMLKSHHLKPGVDHYACIVDLLGRAGRLEEAHGLIQRMPFEANHAVWGALLGACVIHTNVDLGEIAARRLFEIEPESTGSYMMLGNLYAAVGRWEGAAAVRKMLVERGLTKVPGQSLIEARNQ